MTKSLLKILGSSVLAQLLGLAIIPFLVKSYNPGQISLLAFFTTFIGISTILLTLKSENQLFQIDLDGDAASYTVFICFYALSVFILCAPIVYFFGDKVTDIGRMMLAVFMLGGLSLSVHNVLLNLLLRFKNTTGYAVSKAVRSVCEFILYLLCIAFILNEKVLVYSGILAYFIAFSYSVRECRVLLGVCGLKKHIAKGRKLFVRLNKNIQFDFLSSLFNVMSINMPIIYFGMAGDVELAGLYFMVTRLLGAPMLLLGQSISAALKGHAFSEKKEKHSVNGSIEYTVKLLLLYFLPGYILIIPAVNYGFPVFFGSEWIGITSMALILLPYFIARFMFNCLSGMVYVIGEFKSNLIFQGVLLLISLISLWLPFFDGFKIQSYSIGLAICYFFYAFYMVRRCKMMDESQS